MNGFADRVTYEEAQKRCIWANSYTRLGVVLGLRSNMDAAEWHRLLGDKWSSCDNIAQYRPILSRVLRGTPRALLDSMMTEEELNEFRALPDVLTVYRGCYYHNRLGLSWSLDRDVAERFPTLNRYRYPNGSPLLVTGRVRKELVVFKNDRKEREIISPDVRRVSVQPISAKEIPEHAA
jgi:hypothetical protein